MTTPPHPSIARIASVARALGELSADVVFIGGSIAPLLQTDPVLPRVRPTKDVDAIVASTSYASQNVLEIRMRTLGFVTDTSGHAHRWRAPDGTPFDLVPVGEHLGGRGSAWDQAAIDTAVISEIEPGLKVRHASAPGFLALKWAAFQDRGASDPFNSEDLEDILALVVSRNDIVAEFNGAPRALQNHVRRNLRWLLDNPAHDDLVTAYLAHAQTFQQVAQLLRTRLEQMGTDEL